MAPLPISGDYVIPPPNQTQTSATTANNNNVAVSLGVVAGIFLLLSVLICVIRLVRKPASSSSQSQPYKGKTDPDAGTDVTADHWLTPNPMPTGPKPPNYTSAADSGSATDVSGVAEPPPAYPVGDNGGGAAPTVSATSGGV